ncbi:MAG: response regulator [Desulfobacteraceae bacterium]|nr:response regulator [Desulfobacteraceae bacterium]MBC2720279.1 response regulator [Desulfobacteraceae bacterium]
MKNLLKTFHENFGFKIFTAFTILIFIVSSAFTVFFIYHQSSSLTDNLIKNGKLLSEILAYDSKLGVFSENEKLLNNAVDGIFQQEGVLEVSVFNLEKKLLKNQNKPGKWGPKKIIFEDINISNNVFKKLKTYRSSFYIDNKNTIDFWSPVIIGSSYLNEEALFFKENLFRDQNRIIGFICITIDKIILNKRLDGLLAKSISIGIIFLIIGSAFIYILARRITKPLNRLTNSVNILGKSGVVKKVTVETGDEIGKLAIAFNDMSESLKKREEEKHLLEEHLRYTKKMEAIGTLAGGIAHDFNNILAAIMGYTELASLNSSDSDSLKSDLDEIIKASNRAKDLTKQILLFSRQTEQKQKPIKIEIIVKEVLKMMRASLPTTIEIRQNIKTGLDPILSDPTEIHRVLMNLCTNAAHAMQKKGGVLEVTLSDIELDKKTAAQNLDLNPGQYQMLTINDTGHGMDSSVIERIFDPFFTTKKYGEGTGMGLAMTHGILKSCGGTITLNSEVGKGTTFKVFFSAIKSEITVESKQDEQIPHGKERILLVDDEAALVSAGKQLLESLGYKVIAKTNSVEALETFKEQPNNFDIVITDMTMPKMTGENLSKKILAIRPDMPIIICTGFSEVISEKKAKAIGIREFIMKPILRKDIAKIIRVVLNNGKCSPKCSRAVV